MKKLILLLITFTVTATVAAVEVRCPTTIDLKVEGDALPDGWLKYKRRVKSLIHKGQVAGALAHVAVHDGSPNEILGDLIPDNDDSEMKSGYWLWRIEGLGVVYAGCEYVGKDVMLIKRIDGERLRSCRVPVNGTKRNVLTCK